MGVDAIRPATQTQRIGQDGRGTSVACHWYAFAAVLCVDWILNAVMKDLEPVRPCAMGCWGLGVDMLS